MTTGIIVVYSYLFCRFSFAKRSCGFDIENLKMHQDFSMLVNNYHLIKERAVIQKFSAMLSGSTEVKSSIQVENSIAMVLYYCDWGNRGLLKMRDLCVYYRSGFSIRAGLEYESLSFKLYHDVDRYSLGTKWLEDAIYTRVCT